MGCGIMALGSRRAQVGGLLMLAVLAAGAPAWAAHKRASAVAATAAPRAAAVYSFAFRDAEAGQVADEVLGKALGLSYTVDPAITAHISFRIEERLTREQLLAAFEAALGAQDIVMLRDGPRVMLVPRAKAKGQAAPRGPGQRVRAGYEVVVMPLSFATPSEVAKAFQQIGPANVVLHSDDRLGFLLLGGTDREVDTAAQMVRVFDRSGLENTKVRWFELSQAPATTLSQELERVIQGGGVSGVTVLPLRRLNGLIVFARTPQVLDEVGGWVARLDVPSREEASSLWIYRPKNADADGLAQTLNSVLSSQSRTSTSSVAPAPAVGSSATPAQGSAAVAPAVASSSVVISGEDGVRVGVDKPSNTLLISAPASRWVQIQRILDQIDRTPGQVLIEASIVEVTLNNDFSTGVDWSVLADKGQVHLTSTSDPGGAIAPTLPGFAATFLNDNVKVAVSALQSHSDVEVISAPKIVTLDNRTAKLEVGDQVPVVTQSVQNTTATGAPIVLSTDYRNTGVILNVTPRIDGDDKVLLTISQEVSEVAKTTTAGVTSPTIQQRRLDSTLILRDGGTVALGGLISSEKNKGNSGVPYLKDVPALGLLFKSTTKSTRRTELIILLSARIVQTPDQSDMALARLSQDMKEIEGRGLLNH